MKKINIIPTPKVVATELPDGVPFSKRGFTYFFDGACDDILKIALSFSKTELCNESCADIILTTEKTVAERYYEVDDDWFGNKNAYEQGYIICGDPSEKIVIYAKTQLGLSYGITTLLQIANTRGSILIKDYPDFRYRANKWLLWAETEVWSYDFGDGVAAYYERILKKLDLCLKYKVNLIFFDAWGPDVNRSPHYKELMRNCCRAARKRGIHLIFGAYTMGYGLSGHTFGKHFGKVHMTRYSYPDGEIYECLGTLKKSRRKNNGLPFVMAREFGGCLSNEALMNEKLDELCEFVREIEPGALYLHNMDSHLIYKTLWDARCDACRAKWANDDILASDGMAGAFAYYFDRLNSSLKSVKTDNYDAEKDLLIFNVSPGYLEYHVLDEEAKVSFDFWEKVREYSKVKDNVYPLFRELYHNHNTKTFRISDDLAKRTLDFGVIAFVGGDGFYSDHLFPTTALFHKTMLGSDVMITCSGNAFAEPLQLFNAEFMWNADGSLFYDTSCIPDNYDEFLPLFERARAGLYRPESIFGEGGMLDVICQKLYGEDGNIMAEFFRTIGQRGESPAPFPCNRELRTHGSSALFDFVWDKEWSIEDRDEYIAKVSEILTVSQKGFDLLSLSSNVDIVKYRELLGLNLRLLRLLHEYLLIYSDLDAHFINKSQDFVTIGNRVIDLIKNLVSEREYFNAQGFVFADLLKGALARREEIIATLEYDLTLMLDSIKENKRIPERRKERSSGAWW